MPDEKLEAKIQGQLTDLKSTVADVLKKANEVGETGGTFGVELKKSMTKLNDQIKDLQGELNEIQQGNQQLPGDGETKTIGDQAVEGMDFKSSRTSFMVEGKAASSILLSTDHDAITGTGVIQAQRRPGIVSDRQEVLTILDLMTRIPCASNSVEYIQEVNTVLAAAEQAEGDKKAESQFDFILKQMHIATVAHFVKISKQMRDDAPALVAFINKRMVFGVRKTLNRRLIDGDGLMPNINGLVGVAGNHSVYVPKAGDNRYDSIRRAIAAVEDADHDPTAIIMNPMDVADMDLLKDADGNYIASHPKLATGSGAWSLPIVKSKGIPVGKFKVGDFAQGCTMHDREEVTIGMFEQDADNVQKNMITVRAECRAQLTVEFPEAFQYGDLKAA